MDNFNQKIRNFALSDTTTVINFTYNGNTCILNTGDIAYN